MMSQANSIARAFKQLHQSGKPILLANVWDTLSARGVSRLPSCNALATSSFAIARVNGTEDNEMTLDAHLGALKSIASIAKESQKPLTVDFQSGYRAHLEDGVAGLLDLGVAGLNLEDCDNSTLTMYSQADAVSRIQRVLDVATSRGVPDFVVNARCDTLVHGGDFDDVLARGKAYLAAGATTVFVLPGPERKLHREDISKMVKEFDGNLNIGWNPAGAFSINELAELGVARVSVGPAIQLMALDFITKQAEHIMTGASKQK